MEEERDHHFCGVCGSDICCTLPEPPETKASDVCPVCGRVHAAEVIVAEEPKEIEPADRFACKVCGSEICCDVDETVAEVVCPECGSPLDASPVGAP